VEADADPEITKAVELLPQARALYEKARTIVAQRMGGQSPATSH